MIVYTVLLLQIAQQKSLQENIVNPFLTLPISSPKLKRFEVSPNLFLLIWM